jgi:intein/homing endonuclease
MPESGVVTPFQNYIFKSRYARWLPEKNRREDWPETVHRYIEHISKRIPEDIRETTSKELEDAILNFKVMPSMRAMMTAGKALTKDEIAAYNCFSGRQKFLTKGGVKTLIEAYGESQKVINKLGMWADAEVVSFGIQPVQEVAFKPVNGDPETSRSRTNIRRTVTVTPDHRWLTKNRGEVVDLKVGDIVPFVGYTECPMPLCSEAWIRGFGFGDGTIDARGNAKVRLCGEKDKKHLHIFESYGHCSVMFPPSYGGDAVVLFHKGFFSDWKTLPLSDKPIEYLASWLDGYLAADGHSDPHQPGVSSQDDGAIRFVEDIAPLVGYLVTGKNTSSIMETNLGVRKHPLQRLTLRREGGFRVMSITPLEEPEEVFCVVEPSTHTFALVDGILTRNCSYLAIDDPRAFDEAMYISMCGVGLGFSVERQYVNQLPTVDENFFPVDTTIKVRDSKIGWASGFRQLIALLYGGSIPNWDLSSIRPAGSPLKTFGGRASGPEPLDRLFKFTVRLFQNAAGRKLTSIECHDLMCMVADIVISGGVRRSAMISLSNLSDDRMRGAKGGQWWIENPQGALANNSAVYTEKPDIGVFMKEWLSLFESRSGERGIYNRAAAVKKAQWVGRRKWKDIEFGLNPCGEIILRSKGLCVSKHTPLITKTGLLEIGENVNKAVSVWNGKKWSDVVIRKTGSSQQLVRVTLSDGSYLDCTPYHSFSVKTRFQKDWRKVEAKDLMGYSRYPVQVEPAKVVPPSGGKYVEDAYTLGFCVEDGSGSGDSSIVTADLYGNKDQKLPLSGSRAKVRRKKGYNVDSQRISCTKFVDVSLMRSLKTDFLALNDLFLWDRESVLGFIAGWVDADGSETGTDGVRLYISGEFLARKVQLLLTKQGVCSSVNLCEPAGTNTNYGVRSDDLWYLQITDCSSIPSHRVDTKGGHSPKFKGKYQIVRSVEQLPGLHDVFCFSEPKRHKALFGNVLTHQCNLTEVVVRPDETEESLRDKIRLATILGTLQSTLTEFRYLRKDWQKNAEEERLLGVSLSGIMDCKMTSTNDSRLVELLDGLRGYAVSVNTEWAEKLEINPSVAVTCVKPSGTVSQLVNCSPGIHTRFSNYLSRGIREDRKNPIGAFLKACGVPNEPDASKPNDVDIFYFPLASPEGSVTRDALTAVQQLELYLTYRLHWTEHNPSCTIYVKDSEWLEVAAWVYKHFDQIGGVAFLPFSDHIYKQQPYTAISEDDYNRAKINFPSIKWEELEKFEKGDTTTSGKEVACSSGHCDL